MNMRISQAQADALGGCRECEPATAPSVKGESEPLAAVIVADPSKPDWIGIALTERDGSPVAGEPFRVELADGRYITGKLDTLGKIRIEGVEPGSCTVSFPERDGKEWKKR